MTRVGCSITRPALRSPAFRSARRSSTSGVVAGTDERTRAWSRPIAALPGSRTMAAPSIRASNSTPLQAKRTTDGRRQHDATLGSDVDGDRVHHRYCDTSTRDVSLCPKVTLSEHRVAMLRASHEPAPGGASKTGTWKKEDLTDRTISQADTRAACPGRMRLCAAAAGSPGST